MEHVYPNILLSGRGGMNTGQLRISPGGFVWRRQGGGKVVEVAKSDMASLCWTRVPRGYQLGVLLKAGSNVKFNGFKEQDVASLSSFMSTNMGITPQEKALSVSGQNWGNCDIEGNMLSFVVGGKQAFELSLADVSQTQMQGKNDVVLEFHFDDTKGANEKDCLMELSFHIPNSNTTFMGHENHPPSMVFRDRITSMADVGSSGAEPVAVFDEVAILTPRGRYSVELHLSFLRLQGQANDFKIQYSSVVRLFVLPKSSQALTFVVMTLDPPIRKGQTFYYHIVLQFHNEEITECTLSMPEDLLNTKYKDCLESAYKGLSCEVFVQIVRGLSGSKISRPGKFRSSQDGFCVRSSLKAEDGLLYPLEKGFFFLPKPPTLILNEEIDYVEFERHGTTGASSISSHYFDLVIHLKSEQEHQFRNIQRNEYHNLFNFISDKGMKILNLGEVQGAGGVTAALDGSEDETVDPHLNRIKIAREGGGALDTDEEDEDFVAEKDDGGSPTESDSEEESDASDDQKPVKKEPKKKEHTAPKASKKSRSEQGEEEGKKKKRKKKDPNAPKRALSSFMYFSQAERENLKRSNPGIQFTEIGKVLGEKWKKMSGKEKEPYERMAKTDKGRYTSEMEGYRSKGSQAAAAAAAVPDSSESSE